MSFTPISIKDGNGTAQNVAAFQGHSGAHHNAHTLDGTRPMYRASASAVVPQPTAAVVLLRIQGSATKTVRITRIQVEGVSTANANIPIALQRESTAGAGGTEVIPTVAKLDTQFDNATAKVSHFTTTIVAAGTAVGGPLSSAYLSTNVVTTPTLAIAPRVLFPEEGCVGQSIVLRGASDYLVVKNTNAGNLSAGTNLAYTVEWIEDAS